MLRHTETLSSRTANAVESYNYFFASAGGGVGVPEPWWSEEGPSTVTRRDQTFHSDNCSEINAHTLCFVPPFPFVLQF